MVFITKTHKLREYVQTHTPKIFKRAGDGNASLYLYKIEEILSIFKRIDNVDRDKIGGIIREVLK